jgi:hypothetical protein
MPQTALPFITRDAGRTIWQVLGGNYEVEIYIVPAELLFYGGESRLGPGSSK